MADAHSHTSRLRRPWATPRATLRTPTPTTPTTPTPTSTSTFSTPRPNVNAPLPPTPSTTSPYITPTPSPAQSPSPSAYHVQPQPQPSHLPVPHALRAAESRFSLREQFATTRREIEFGYDDSSSILDRATLASDRRDGSFLLVSSETGGQRQRQDQGSSPDQKEDGVPVPVDDQVVLPPYGDPGGEDGPWEGDAYDTLCISREPAPGREVIREAHTRAVLRLGVAAAGADGEDDGNRVRGDDVEIIVAKEYIRRAQTAFETLIDPALREECDAHARFHNAAALEEDDGGVISRACIAAKEDVRESQIEAWEGGMTSQSNVAMRLDATPLIFPVRNGRGPGGIRPADFAMRQSFALGVPGLGRLVQERIAWTNDLISSMATKTASLTPSASENALPFRLADPQFALSAEVHTLADPYANSSHLPSTEPLLQRPGISHTHINKPNAIYGGTHARPIILANLRQEITYPETSRHKSTTLEAEAGILPAQTLTARAEHRFDKSSIGITCFVPTSHNQASFRPRVNITAATNHHSIDGSSFVAVDTGTWGQLTQNDDNEETCRYYGDFSRIAGGVRQALALLPVYVPPSVEVGFSSDPARIGDLVVPTTSAELESAMLSKGGLLRGKCWSVSAGASTNDLAVYLRYTQPLSSSASPSPTLRISVKAPISSSPTLTVETSHLISRVTTLSLSTTLTPSTVCLSLSLTHLSHCFTLPLCIYSPQPHLSFPLSLPLPVIVAALAPSLPPLFRELYLKIRKWQQPHLPTKSSPKSPRTVSKAQVERYISQRRAEADILTHILARRLRRADTASSTRDMYIVSAKFAVRDAQPDDVADVTVALDSLLLEAIEGRDAGDGVGGGRGGVGMKSVVVIPRGVRKGALPGFWDPAPGRRKVLTVWYMYGGVVREVEVPGREALVLPR